jgi:hypothetical protein
MKVPVIVNYEKRGETVKEFTILCSSFGYQRDGDGAYLKLLWIPLKIGEGDKTLADNEEYPDIDIYGGKGMSGYNMFHANLAANSLEGKAYFKMDFKL